MFEAGKTQTFFTQTKINQSIRKKYTPNNKLEGCKIFCSLFFASDVSF